MVIGCEISILCHNSYTINISIFNSGIDRSAFKNMEHAVFPASEKPYGSFYIEKNKQQIHLTMTQLHLFIK